MAFRFRSTLRIAPGVRLNLSKSGASWSIGRKGATLNLGGRRGPRATIGLPGTGLSWSERLGPAPANDQATGAREDDGGLAIALLILVALLVLYVVL